MHLPAEPRQAVVLARDEFDDLDATEGRDLVQRRAEMNRPFERRVVRRVGVQANRRGGRFCRRGSCWSGERRDVVHMWDRLRRRRRSHGRQQERVQLFRRRGNFFPSHLVQPLVRFEADRQPARRRTARVRRGEERHGPDAELPVLVGGEAEREGKRPAFVGQGQEVRSPRRE